MAVSVLLLLYGLVVVESNDSKGRAGLIAVGAYSVICSFALIALSRIRSRLDPSS